jgi:plasmid stabilization system protein ParE
VKYHVELTSRAAADVDGVLRWFHEREASQASQRWLRQLMARIDTLEKRPERCPLAAEADEAGIDVRALLFGKRRGIYRILFVVDGQTVSILHLRHTARSAPSPEDLQ